ncbi:MAG: RDD family protein, partial [candidate division WOR-3 bacterium]
MEAQGTQTGYAGFWRRLVALIIDAVILNIVFYILAAIFAVPYGMAGPAARTAGFFSGFNFVTIIIAWLYYALMESSE